MNRLVLLMVAGSLFAAAVAHGGLRMATGIESAGVVPGKPEHLVIVLNGGEWHAVESVDAGLTWSTLAEAEVPATLDPLPALGNPAYRQAGDHVIVSQDDGATWRPVAPWGYLRQLTQERVDEEKALYLAKYGKWLPAREGQRPWIISFALSALCLLGIMALLQARRREPWALSTLLSLGAYGLFAVALAAISIHYTEVFCGHQWTARLAHWDNGLDFPKWPLGMLLQVTGNVYLAPLAALIVFPLTPLFSASGPPPGTRWLQWRTWWARASVLSLLLMPIAAYVGRGWTPGIWD